MFKRAKRMAALLTAAAMALTLTACSGSGDNAGQGGKSAETTVTADKSGKETVRMIIPGVKREFDCRSGIRSGDEKVWGISGFSECKDT